MYLNVMHCTLWMPMPKQTEQWKSHTNTRYPSDGNNAQDMHTHTHTPTAYNTERVRGWNRQDNYPSLNYINNNNNINYMLWKHQNKTHININMGSVLVSAGIALLWVKSIFGSFTRWRCCYCRLQSHCCHCACCCCCCCLWIVGLRRHKHKPNTTASILHGSGLA